MMERLTGYENIAGHFHNIPLVDTQLAVDRLASYEDTGLTAEQVKAQKWISVKDRLPEKLEPVNIVWVNRKPERYYAEIKDKPFVATGVYWNDKWWWYSATCEDYLAEYGRSDVDAVDEAIEITHWMPLPEPPAEAALKEQKAQK